MMQICLQNFRTAAPVMGKHETAITEALLHLAGLSEIMDTPDGRRVFTVYRMPDNVPIAGIYWEAYEGGVKIEDYQGGIFREPDCICLVCKGAGCPHCPYRAVRGPGSVRP